MGISFEKSIKQKLPSSPKYVWGRIFLVAVGSFVIAIIGAVAIAAVYSLSFQDKVYPGVYLGNYPLGGLNKNDLIVLVEGINNDLATNGLDFLVLKQDQSKTVKTLKTVIATDSAVEILALEGDALVTAALQAGRQGTQLDKWVQPILLRFNQRAMVKAPIIVDKINLKEELKNILVELEDAPSNAALRFAPDSSTSYEVIAEKEGYVFNYDKIVDTIVDQLEVGSLKPIKISLEKFTPSITFKDVAKAANNLPTLLSFGNLGFNYVDPRTKLRQDWEVGMGKLASWLEPVRNSDQEVVFTVNKSLVVNYLNETVAAKVERPAKEAKFNIAGEKVVEFQGSQSGLSVDVNKTYQDFVSAFMERNYNISIPVKTVSLSVDIIDPKVKTADLNDLGITEVLGVGISSFKGSPRNRIKNIGRAAELLNGTLVKPGDQFSTNQSAGPYTAANGYLPEMVIKGNQIKPEVGGGMCQIGTTLFRMAMNSGMPITERRNHSLVVSFYSDPVNNNPGTDATVYDPLVDFKFLNDTGNYILVQTDIDSEKQDLIFTLWGKPDGRSGAYTHPKVDRWIPVGATVRNEVSDGSLAPGQEKCQSAFTGAVANFTYSRTTPQGEKIDKVFESYYRPLPRICIVGVEPAAEAAVDEVERDLVF